MRAKFFKPIICCISLLLASFYSVATLSAENSLANSTYQSISEKNADERTISGVVLDAQTKEPLVGAAVVDAKSNIGTTTDLNGKFSIKVKPTTKALLVSFVGYITNKVEIGENTILNILLDESGEMLNEVVVTGIQSIERGRATGAFSILRQDDISSIYSTNLSEKLEGVVPGLYVDKNNDMTIRGLGSLNASTKPLIVVDGFPLESSELNLNPNDIEQISVLKDAASASIWGIRAANGVIVVTTKKGNGSGKVNVNYSGVVTSSAKPKWSDLHLLSSDQYVAANFANILGQGISTSAYGGLNELEKIYQSYDNGILSLGDAWNQVNLLGRFNNSKQITDKFYRHAFTQQHNVSLSANSEKVSTYASLSFDQNRMQLQGNEYNKFNLLVNNDFKLHKTFTVTLGLRGTYQKAKNNGVDMTGYEPWMRILNDDGSYYNEYNGISESWAEECYTLGMRDWHKNSLEIMKMNDNKSTEYNLSSSLRLVWKPIPGLTLSSQGTYEFGNTQNVQFFSQNHYKTRDLTNRFTEVAVEDGHPVGIVANHLPTSGGIKNLYDTHLQSYSIRNTISYNNAFKDFEYRAMVGNEIYSLEGNQYSNWLWGFDPDLLTYQSVDLASLQSGVYGYNGRIQTLDEDVYSTSYVERLERYVSWFGTANISYSNKYDLFGSIRLDQTNLLTNASKFRNNPSWSVGAKWNISKENFLHSSWIDNLSLRVSYGLTGNIDKRTGPDIVGQASSDYNIPNLNYIMITNPANPSLGWEKTYSWNIGIDYMFFNGRLSGAFDFYHKRSKGLLADVDVDPTIGWSKFFKNSATVCNTGFDWAIHGRILTDTPVKWDVTLNLSYNKNKVTEMNYTPSRKGACKGNPMQGYPIGSIVVHRYGGLDEFGEPTFMKKGDDTKYHYSELNSLELEDLEYMGSSNPPVFGSFSSLLRYREFSLSFMITYRFGSKLRLPAPKNTTTGMYSEWFGEEYRWIDGADNANKWVPSQYTESPWSPKNRDECLLFSDQMVDSGDAIYFKSLKFMYDATKILNKIGIKGGSISIGGEDLCFWAKNKYNLDPDQISVSGEVYDTYCSFGKCPRLVVGLNLNF